MYDVYILLKCADYRLTQLESKEVQFDDYILKGTR